MGKCKVIDLFEVSWGTVVVLDFFEAPAIKLGVMLRNSNDCFWKITGIARSKFVLNEKYKDLINSVHVLDCTITPINHTKAPSIGEILTLVNE